jgi:nucleoid-associated protein YgaU
LRCGHAGGDAALEKRIMSRIVTAFRFLFGLAMVAGGAALAAPTVSALVQEIARHRQAMAALPPAPPSAGGIPAWQPPVAPTLAMQPPAAAWPPVDDGAGTGPNDGLPPSPHYQPPPPPAPLPPLPREFGAMAPDVAGAYRSTLQVPPPPLLDAHQPPPLAAGWTAHGVAAPVAVMPDAVVPQAYVVRDGDDLTGIATRFYGHASASAAIWTANRDALPDPNVLPIGAVLRLPPAWTVFAARGGDGRAIEPQAAAGPAAAPPPTAAPLARPVGWLAGGATTPASVPRPPEPQRPAAVRVAPGETLDSLARRFYGDERMAGRIWEANRDRLRSPELVVAGMELRLP